MAEMGAITIPLTFGFRESLARELREAADALDPRPPSVTAEDLRGAEAEIDRLTHLLGSHAAGHRCTCTMTAPANYDIEGGNAHPAEWEEDPWCPTHPDMDHVLTEVERLRKVAEAAEDYVEYVAAYDSMDSPTGRLNAAVRAYRAATTGEAGQ